MRAATAGPSSPERSPPTERPRGPTPPGGSPAGPTPEHVRLAIRLVLHLEAVGPPPRDGEAPTALTQAGIGAALAATQGAVSKVLRQLVAAEVVRRERLHAARMVRRVRVYSLTRRGELLAGELRARTSGRATPPEPPVLAAGATSPPLARGQREPQ